MCRVPENVDITGRNLFGVNRNIFLSKFGWIVELVFYTSCDILINIRSVMRLLIYEKNTCTKIVIK